MRRSAPISIKEDAVANKPKALTMEEAASIPLVGLTAWQALMGIFAYPLSSQAWHELRHLRFRVMSSNVGKRIRGNMFDEILIDMIRAN